MSIFNAVGIYIMVNLDWNHTGPMYTADPVPSYTFKYMQGIFAVIDALKDYENVLGFIVADHLFIDGLPSAFAPLYTRVRRQILFYIQQTANKMHFPRL